MFRFITETFHRLIESVSLSRTRYLYPTFNLRNRLTGLVGPRGVGKTTLLLQYIKKELFKEGKSFYFSADLIEGSHDLSRRAKLYRLHGLSFREYLNFTLNDQLKSISFQEILEDTSGCLSKLKSINRLLPHFEDYLRRGYYPFFFEDPDSYYEKMSRVVDKTVFEDIANYYNLKTPSLQYFKRLLTYLASIPPGDLNIHNLAKSLGVDHKTVEHYVTILASVGLVREMRLYERGSAGVRKPAKLLLNNTNLIHMLQQYLGKEPSKGMERELFFIQSMQNADQEIFYSKQTDYRTRQAVFEIGGKNKNRTQLKELKKPSYIVKDGILQSLKGEIPLFLFGFLY
jgi:predicted AAA+ superfamily ATPase